MFLLFKMYFSTNKNKTKCQCQKVKYYIYMYLRKWNECLKDKGLKIYEEKTKVMCESFGTGTTQVVGNVKHPCSVCLKGVGVNSIRCTQCIQ